MEEEVQEEVNDVTPQPDQSNKDANQDVLDNLSDMLETGSPTQKYDEQVSHISFEVNDMENNMSDKIYDNVIEYVHTDEVSVLNNN